MLISIASVLVFLFFPTFNSALLLLLGFFCLQGDCHLTVWSSWSSCQLTCLEGRSFEATGRRARSRAVIIQAAENQGSCPQQVFETQSCKGTEEIRF